MVDYGSYNITTYIRQNKKMKNKRKRKKSRKIYR